MVGAITSERLDGFRQNPQRRARQLMAKGLTAREAAARIKVGKTALCRALQPQS
jgi:hypothetical protein